MSKNISPEIEAAIQEGREMGLREAAAYVRGLKETFVPYVVRGLDSAHHGKENPEGWAPLSASTLRLFSTTASGIIRLIKDEPMPQHDHVWSDQSDGSSICAICGQTKNESQSAKAG